MTNLIKMVKDLGTKQATRHAEMLATILELVRRQMSCIFCDCTIKFTSPYRLACSSTRKKPDHLHVHKLSVQQDVVC
jgi:hypothetical protein